MAVATIESAFVLVDRASGPVRKIRREVRGLERDARKAGRALDEMGGPKAARDLDVTADKVHGLRNEVGALPNETRRTERAMHDLDRTVTRAGRNAKQSSTYFSMLKDRTTLLAGAAVAALPAIQALGGAAGALGGSLMGAGLGAGGIAIAGGGSLAAGIGALAAVAIPAKKNLEQAQKAQQKYTDTVADFGAKSKQAAKAKRELDQAMSTAPRGTRELLGQLRAINREWAQATRGAQGDLLGLGADAIRTFRRRALDRVAGDARTVTRATRTQGNALTNFLTDPGQLRTIDLLTKSFASNLDEAEHTTEHVLRTLANIAEASLPFFHEGMTFIDHWTGGWEKSTSDISGLRRQMGGYVNDLKAWGHLTESAFGLAKDVLMGGRPSGTNMVEDLTKTLDHWDQWVQRNPDKIDRFFRDAVTDTEKIAGSLATAAKGLNDMATELRPLLAPLTRLVTLAGQLSSSLSPGAAATLLLGARGLRNTIARGGGGGAAATGVAATTAGGGGLMPLLLGGGGAAGGAARAVGGLTMRERGQRFMWQRQLAAEGALFGGPGLGGNIAAARVASRGLGGAAAGGALRMGGTAARFALPAVVMGGLQGAFGPGGANQGTDPLSRLMWGIRNAGQGAGAMFGIANPVMGADERVNRGLSRAQQFVSQLPGGQAPTATQARSAARGLVPELSRAEQAAADAATSGDRNKVGEAMAYLKALREQARAYRQIAKDAHHAAEVERNERSRKHAFNLLDSFGKAFDIYSKRMGPEKAMDKTLDGVYSKMRGMNRTGAKILGENTLAWAREQARKNPALQGEVDKLARRIERRFSRMGDRVKIINGQILTGSADQWKSIGAAITDPANRALSETSAAFAQLRDQAVGALEMMGYSHADALAVFKGVRSGTISRSEAGTKTGSGQPRLQSDANKARSHGYKRPIGDGLGTTDRMTLARSQQAGGGATGLMGANPNLGPYAALGTQMGLHTSSGKRPGAITSSGNVSYHSSGHAIDEAGSAAAMMSYARTMATRYGSGLEELIHSPLGWGIKDGKRVPLSYFGEAVIRDHYDHVHVADVDPGGGGGLTVPFSPDTAGPGMQSINLRAPRSGQGGVWGALSDAATGGFAAGLMDKANAALGGGFDGGPGGGLSSAGGKYNKSALANLWVSAGGDPGVASLMAAIALAESGGNPSAHNPSGATGLWQILGNPFPGNARDPGTNARMAVAKYSSQGLGAWEAYTKGMYRRFTGDGLGWGRPRLSGGGAGILRRSAGAGGVAVHNTVHVNATAGDERRVVAIVNRHLDEFARHVEEEIGRGAEESVDGVMA